MKKIMSVILLISVFLMPSQVFALSCPEPLAPDLAYEEYDAVIIGSVAKIETNAEEKILTIKVQKSFKGVDKTVITVKEDSTWGESQNGFKYLYYLNEDGANWDHPLCSPTTNDLGIADEFYGDIEEVALQEVEGAEDTSQKTIMAVLIGVMIVALIVFWRRKRKKS